MDDELLWKASRRFKIHFCEIKHVGALLLYLQQLTYMSIAVKRKAADTIRGTQIYVTN